MTMGCYLLLMNFGNGGSSMGSLANEFNEEMVMEWINGRSILKLSTKFFFYVVVGLLVGASCFSLGNMHLLLIC